MAGSWRWQGRLVVLSIAMVALAGVLWHGDALAASAAVGIQGFAFGPAAVSVNAGDAVTWTNNQTGIVHTVTADDNSFDSGRLAAGQTFTMTFSRAGTVAYHCNIHPTMHGTVTVAAAAAGAPAQASATARAAAPPPPPPPPPAPAAPARTATTAARPAATTTVQRPAAAPANRRPAAPAARPAAPAARPAAPAARPTQVLPRTGTAGLDGGSGTPTAALTLGAVALILAGAGAYGLRRSRITC